MRFLILLPLLVIAGCDSSYRYPCQDPANWGKLECNNEVCEADGTCTKHTVGPNINTNVSQPSSEEASTPTEETVTEANTEISSDTNSNSSDKAKVVGHKSNKEVVMDPEGDEHEMPAHTPPSMDEEVPVTMNTIVDTAAHNAATK